jgi:hypothetical protein
MAKGFSTVAMLVIGALLLAGCGGSAAVDSTAGSGSATQVTPTFHPVGDRANGNLGKAKARRVESLALHNHFVERIAGDRQITVAGPVARWVTEGGRHLIGGVVKIPISPPARFTNLRLPATISPNHKAPPGTPTLYRYARMSATNVGELEVAVDLSEGRPVRIEPSGDGYRITKLELIGPSPKNPAAYAPEPGY